jgi:hypothetical protein
MSTPKQKCAVWLAAPLAAVLLFALTPSNAHAQATDGNLTGAILDVTGAAVPNAGVELENTTTGIRFAGRSDASGIYRLLNVPAGSYSLTATAPGFAQSRVANVAVELNRTTTANLTLQVGGVSESVTVTEAAAAVDAATAQIQSTYTSRQILDLPITAQSLGANNLSLLSAGVAGSGGYGLGEGPSIGGQRPRNNSFNIEGVDNNRKDVTGSQSPVSNEAVAEFTLLQNQFSAEFGHAGGGQFNTILRSGTNTLHGTAYEYMQNRNLNAVDESLKRQGVRSNPRTDNNRFGGNLAGPVLRNKLFYFGQLEYNPAGFAATPSSPTLAPTAEGYSRLASIPGASKTNLDVLQRYLSPAASASQNTQVSGIAIPIGIVPIVFPAYQNTRSWIGSMDYNISSNDQLRGRYMDRNSSGVDGSIVPSLPAFLNTRGTATKFLMLTENHVFTPSLTNEVRFGYHRYNDTIPSGSFDYPGLDVFPNITIQNDLNANVGPFLYSPQSTILNTYQLVENVNWIRGSHALKFGFDGRDYIGKIDFVQLQRGDYAYTTLERYVLDLPPDVRADRSLGGAPYVGNARNYYGFVNDDWRVRRNLSLNLGVRYEYKGVPRNDKLQALNASSSRPGLLDFRAPEAQKTNFAPRLGFAWSPGIDAKTSIRGGFGMAYDNYFDNLGTNSKPPQLESMVHDPLGGEKPGYLAAGGIAPGRRPDALTPAQALASTAAYIPDQNLPYSIQWSAGVQRSLAHDYTLEVRYLGTRGVRLFMQTRPNTQAVATADRSLPTYLQQPGQAALDALPLTLEQLKTESFITPEFAAAGFRQPVQVFANRGNSIYHGLASELTRRFSNGLLFRGAYTWSKLIDDSTADVNSTALAPRRPQDSQDLRAERARSFLDRTHRLTWSWVYDVPFFRERNWLVRNVAGNWLIGGVYTFESPQYATVQSGIDSNLNGDSAGDRAIVNPGGDATKGSGVTALKNSAGQTVAYLANDPLARYIAAGSGTHPNAGRNTIPMGRINNWDLNLTKRFAVTERVKFEVRGYFLNALNHAQYTPGYVNSVLFHPSNATRNHLIPGNSLFGDYTRVFDSNSRTMQLVARLTF